MSRFLNTSTGGTQGGVQKDLGLKWGQDKQGLWHILPHYRTIGENIMREYECRLAETILVKVADAAPEAAEMCPQCRGYITSLIVEEL